jgi:hypothetical protein
LIPLLIQGHQRAVEHLSMLFPLFQHTVSFGLFMFGMMA